MYGKVTLTALGLALALLTLAVLRVPAVESETTTDSKSPADLRALIETYVEQGHTLSLHFHEPLFPGESFAEVSAGRVYAGDDYVCITEGWNDDTRHRCTPFHNLISVSFVTAGRP